MRARSFCSAWTSACLGCSSSARMLRPRPQGSERRALGEGCRRSTSYLTKISRNLRARKLRPPPQGSERRALGSRRLLAPAQPRLGGAAAAACGAAVQQSLALVANDRADVLVWLRACQTLVASHPSFFCIAVLRRQSRWARRAADRRRGAAARRADAFAAQQRVHGRQSSWLLLHGHIGEATCSACMCTRAADRAHVHTRALQRSRYSRWSMADRDMRERRPRVRGALHACCRPGPRAAVAWPGAVCVRRLPPRAEVRAT